MKSLTAPLAAMQSNPSRVPVLSVIVENKVGAVRRLDFFNHDSNTWTAGKHDIAISGNNTLHRVRMESGTVKYQRVTNPDLGPFTSWTDLVTGMGSQVAIAASGNNVLIVYTNAAGTGIRYRESTDAGATFGSDTLLTTAAATVQDLACAYKTNGDAAVAWVTSTTLNAKRRVSSSWQGDSASGISFASLNGVAMTYGLDWDILITGTEVTTTKPTVWAVVHGDGQEESAGVWGALEKVTQAESTASTSFQAPFLLYADTFRATFVEVPTYAGGATRVYRTWLHPLITFQNGDFTWRAPLPSDRTEAEGLAICASSGVTGIYVYESNTQTLQRAARDAVTLDVSADVLAFDLREGTEEAGGWVELSNASGQYAGPPPPLVVGNQVRVSVGYRTSNGDESVALATFWLSRVEYRRSGGRSRLRLHLESGFDLLRRNRSRTAIHHTADSYLSITSRIFSRAGLLQTTNGVSSRSQNVIPNFTIAPDTDGLTAFRQILDVLADRPFMLSNAQSRLTEPLAIDSDDIDLTTLNGGAHPLYELDLQFAGVPASDVQAFGAGVFGESFQFPDAGPHGIGQLARVRDLSSDTTTEIANTAIAHRRQRKLDERNGRIVCAPLIAIEPLDVVKFSEGHFGGAFRRRAMEVRWRYDRDARPARFWQEVALGPL